MEQDRKRQALGKGLGALIPGGEESTPPGSLLLVPIDEVFPNPDQPRKKFEKNSLKGLADSIREKGILQAILVQKVPGGYELVAGERRLRAARLAGLRRIPVQVRKLQEEEKIELALIENIQRENLNPVEEAQAYRELQDRYGFTQLEVAKRVGKDRATVANAVRILALPEYVKKELIEGNISAGHARALLSLDREADLRSMLSSIQKKGLSVRQVEQAVTRKKSRTDARGKKAAKPIELIDLEKRLSRKLAVKVRINAGVKGGRVEVFYCNLDELNSLVDILMSNRDGGKK